MGSRTSLEGLVYCLLAGVYFFEDSRDIFSVLCFICLVCEMMGSLPWSECD